MEERDWLSRAHPRRSAACGTSSSMGMGEYSSCTPDVLCPPNDQ